MISHRSPKLKIILPLFSSCIPTSMNDTPIHSDNQARTLWVIFNLLPSFFPQMQVTLDSTS